MTRSILILILIPFSVLSAIALWQHGYWGLFEGQFRTWGTRQVLADLLIAVSLAMVWIWYDAKATGRNAWPWIALSLVTGSFGPLLYLLTRRNAPDQPKAG
jgi:Terpene cyclase DEP1